jgi:hypothetical protein
MRIKDNEHEAGCQYPDQNENEDVCRTESELEAEEDQGHDCQDEREKITALRRSWGQQQAQI